MRPVFRGPTPTKPDGSVKIVTDYNDWRGDLINRLGRYCSYCEIPLTHSANVEHVTPQALAPSLQLEWSNMLLACSSCNGSKGKKPCSPVTHILPDYHNGVLAFTVQLVMVRRRRLPSLPGCIVIRRLGLTAASQAKAEATIQLCSLNKAKRLAKASDRRWELRWEALQSAKEWRKDWDAIPVVNRVRFIVLLLTAAVPTGFFSVWFEVFDDVPEIKQALLTAFPGTEISCFDSSAGYTPTVRVAGDL